MAWDTAGHQGSSGGGAPSVMAALRVALRSGRGSSSTGKAGYSAAACSDDWSVAEEAPTGHVQHLSPKLCTSPSDASGVGVGQENIPASELTLQERIGSGSTAEVYKGLWRGQVVAIKELKSARMKNSEKVAFVREMSILGKVCHPNLVHMYGVTFTDRPWRIVTEFCEGGTLFDLLYEHEETELTWVRRAKICTDIAVAMDYLHRFPPPIIHRDLKSLNLLLAKALCPSSSSTRPGRASADLPVVKVSDFGLARMKEASAEGGEWGKMTFGAGTLNWMAPEVLGGTLYDEKVDVYSFAMVVYEVICVEIPFEDEDQKNLAGLVVDGMRPNLQEAVPPDSPPLMVRLMENCWAQDPKLRPSFQEVLATLETVSRGLDWGTCSTKS